MYAINAYVISSTILDGAPWDKNTYRATDRAMTNKDRATDRSTKSTDEPSAAWKLP
jgi:hypothetical protein